MTVLAGNVDQTSVQDFIPELKNLHPYIFHKSIRFPSLYPLNH